MAFTLPTFNIQVAIRTGGITGPLRVTVMANLAIGRRVNLIATGGTFDRGIIAVDVYLLLPTGTDIRGPLSTTSSDGIEAPVGSGKLYRVDFVEVVATGFPNEHIVAFLQQREQPTPLQ